MTEPISEAAFREALSRFASGVTVVTAVATTGPVGFTASAFTSVSLSPPLVLVCVAKKASVHDALIAAPRFGVSLLASGQRWIAEQFGRPGANRFQNVPLRGGSSTVPLIEASLASLECARHATHEAGDHTLLVGEVVGVTVTTGAPLLHYSRQYGSFAAETSPPKATANGAPSAGVAPRRELVVVTGSPSATSRSQFVATALVERAQRAGHHARVFALRDFSADELVLGQTSGASARSFLQAIAGSAAIVLSTPVYKATYAGGLKTIVDLIPADALVDKPALGIATTKLEAHGREVDQAYRGLFRFFRARPIDSLVVLDDELRMEGDRGAFAPSAAQRVDRAATDLIAALAAPATTETRP
jgi:flavin reductase (DIM6/NTAB) family NADH-FMN oxidoreductase RutF/NAD(P)H-dependent FMN reductase